MWLKDQEKETKDKQFEEMENQIITWESEAKGSNLN